MGIFAEEIEDDGVYKKCETDYNESKVIVDRQIKAAEAILKEAPSFWWIKHQDR